MDKRYELDGVIFFFEETKKKLNSEKMRIVLLKERVVVWRLKSRVLWLEKVLMRSLSIFINLQTEGEILIQF